MINIKSYLKNELFISSIFLLLLTNIGNLFNLLFQFFMARMLNDNDFGILSFITSLIFLFGVPSLAIQTIIAKKTAELNNKGDFGKIKGIFSFTTKRLFLFSLFLILIFELIFFIIYKKVDIPFHILLISSSMICFSFIYPAIMGIIQGMKKFMILGWNTTIMFFIKLVIGVSLVFFGFRVYGALIGIIVSSFVAWFIATLSLKNIKEEKYSTKIYSKQELLPLIVIFIITIMYSFDIILGKFLFNPDIMGAYSKISLLGKMILFAGLSVAAVMLPLSSERNVMKKSSKGILTKAIALLTIITLVGILIINFFKEQIISLLFGTEYLSLSSIVLPLCLAFGFISFSNLFLIYKIAINKIKKWNVFALLSIITIEIVSMIIVGQNIQYFSLVFAFFSLITFIFSLYLIIVDKK